jgi:alpha-N-arabinofuranosidase
MFGSLHGDEILATDSQNIPTREWVRRGRGGAASPPQQIRQVFFNATRNSKSGVIYLKVVNTAGTAQPISVQISGAPKIKAEGEAVSLVGKGLDDTNSIQDPRKVVPRTEKAEGLSSSFTREFPAYSVTIMKLKTK